MKNNSELFIDPPLWQEENFTNNNNNIQLTNNNNNIDIINMSNNNNINNINNNNSSNIMIK